MLCYKHESKITGSEIGEVMRYTRHPSLPRAFLPKVVGYVTRHRPKTNLDPDSTEMQAFHFREDSDGRYTKVYETESHSVRVLRLPCGHDAPEDRLDVVELMGMNSDIDPLELFREGPIHISSPAVSDLSSVVKCPVCHKECRIIDEASLELERSYNFPKEGMGGRWF